MINLITFSPALRSPDRHCGVVAADHGSVCDSWSRIRVMAALLCLELPLTQCRPSLLCWSVSTSSTVMFALGLGLKPPPLLSCAAPGDARFVAPAWWCPWQVSCLLYASDGRSLSAPRFAIRLDGDLPQCPNCAETRELSPAVHPAGACIQVSRGDPGRSFGPFDGGLFTRVNPVMAGKHHTG